MKRTSSTMAKPLREAASRENMRPLGVWIPNQMHRALVQLRADEGLATSEVVRLAIAAWLARHAQRKGRPS